jgi:hypothetical protein
MCSVTCIQTAQDRCIGRLIYIFHGIFCRIDRSRENSCIHLSERFAAAEVLEHSLLGVDLTAVL